MIRPEPRCAMCGNQPVDHGLMCPTCRDQDRAIHSGCDCAVCTSDLAKIAPCMKDQPA